MKKIFFFAGPSGTGKTTHGEWWANKYSLPTIETSACLKNFVEKHLHSQNLFFRQKAAEIANRMARGESNDPLTVWLTIKEEIELSFPKAVATVVFGFPRLFEQLDLIDEDYEIGKLIVFQLSDDERRKRMLQQIGRNDKSGKAILNRLKATDLTMENLPKKYKKFVAFISSAGSIEETRALVKAALAGAV